MQHGVVFDHVLPWVHKRCVEFVGDGGAAAVACDEQALGDQLLNGFADGGTRHAKVFSKFAFGGDAIARTQRTIQNLALNFVDHAIGQTNNRG